MIPQQRVEIKDWIQYMMRIHGLTQSELAERIDVHQTQISRWTRGIAIPDRAHRTILAETFSVPEADVHNLVGDSGAIRSTSESPDKVRAHQLIDVMHPDVVRALLPIMERLVMTGVK